MPCPQPVTSSGDTRNIETATTYELFAPKPEKGNREKEKPQKEKPLIHANFYQRSSAKISGSKKPESKAHVNRRVLRKVTLKKLNK